MALIPGLPNDIALDCLIRVPFSQIQSFKSVWGAQIDLPELLRLRKSTGKAQHLVVLHHGKAHKGSAIENYLAVFEPETGYWSALPPLPYLKGLPVFCEMVSVGSYLVFMGGNDSETMEPLDSVFVFDFVSSKWRCGASMPDGHRLFFAYAADGDRTVFVAGGVDIMYSALQSAWTYDVVTNKWAQLPDLTNCHSYCEGLFYRGKFHVIVKNTFYLSLEIFDTSARQWLEKDDVRLETINSNERCIEGSNKKLYTCIAKDLVVLEDDGWKFVARLPVEVTKVNFTLIALPGHLLLTVKSDAYKLDLKQLIWTTVQVPIQYNNSEHSACCVVI